MAVTITESTGIYRVQVLERVFDIIDTLAEDSAELTVYDFSQRLHLHRSTVHRLLMVLQQREYVEKSSLTGKYRLGSKLLELGARAAARLDLPTVARPLLERLVRECGETAHMGILREGEVVSITNVESSRTLQVPSTVGQRSPVHCSSIGKCILAHLTEAEVDGIVATRGLRRYTAKTITGAGRLKAELRGVRETGYAVDDEEFEEGLRCIGAPVRDSSGDTIAALSIAGPTARLSEIRMPVLARSVIEAAQDLSAALGYRAEGTAVPHSPSRWREADG